MTLAVTDELLASLRGFGGTLLLPGDRGYEHARGVFNAMVDRRPGLIARCQGQADVVAVVCFAREHGLEVSVRGGGHNVAGTAVTDGGVMIDLSGMTGIHVDPVARTARAQGGVIWRQLDRETQLHGLAVPGGTVSTTGIAGLTLGGGHGWLSGRHGLTADNLLSARVVTADGGALTASADEHEDLFWALRGGGGNFGIVTSFHYRLHPVGPTVTGGLVLHPYARAPDLLRFYRELAAGAPEGLEMDAALHFAPGGSRERVASLAVCHLGTFEQAETQLRPILTFGPHLESRVGPLPYAALNSMLDRANPPGRFNYWKSGFIPELSDGAIDVLVAGLERCPSPLSALVLRRFHGAVTRVPVAETSFPHREPGFHVAATSAWLDPAAAEENVAWAQETFAELGPFLAPGRWASFLDVDDGEDGARAAFGSNLERLERVKAAYDPENLFRLNINIKPTEQGAWR